VTSGTKSASALCVVTPGFSRAATYHPKLPVGTLAQSNRVGIHMSGDSLSSRFGGSTPRIVAVSPSTFTVRPMAERSPPNRRCHSRSLITTTSGAPRVSWTLVNN
jgi:hypothetical protein